MIEPATSDLSPRPIVVFQTPMACHRPSTCIGTSPLPHSKVLGFWDRCTESAPLAHLKHSAY